MRVTFGPKLCILSMQLRLPGVLESTSDEDKKHNYDTVSRNSVNHFILSCSFQVLELDGWMTCDFISFSTVF